MKFKDLVTSENVDAIYINDVYQDEGKPLSLSDDDIKSYQFNVEFFTKDGRKIKLFFHSAEEAMQFARAYSLK